MPAKKAARQSVKRYQRNHSVRRATRTHLRDALRAFGTDDPIASEPALRQAFSALDKAVKKGVIHKNNASRKKSRMAARFNRTQHAPA